MQDRERDAEQAGGLLQSLRGLAANVIALVHTRLELLAAEVEEERLRLIELLFWGCVAVFFLSLGVLMATLFVLLLFWDTHRLLISAMFAASYLAVGVVAVLAARNRARARARLFSTSLAELEKDRTELTPR
ncbi:MAG: phage holin family protein [Betaproteobacteria bacterium]|nr:phage holin family protein [Betaproteobacteria bacterium]